MHSCRGDGAHALEVCNFMSLRSDPRCQVPQVDLGSARKPEFENS